jgi:hypothetical protein
MRQIGKWRACSSDSVLRSVASQALVHPATIVIALKQLRFSFQISGIPKEQVVQILLPYRPDKPLDKGMGDGNARHRGDRFYSQHPQVGLPALELE